MNKKEDILKAITDEPTRQSVEAVLNFAEAAAKEAAQNGQTKEQVEKLVTEKIEAHEIDVKKIAGLQEQLDKLGTEISAMKEGGDMKTKELGQVIRESIKQLSEVAEGPSPARAQLKISLDSVMKTTVTPSSFTTDYRGARLDGYGQMAFKKMKIAPLFAQFPIGADSKGIIYYTDMTTGTRNAAARSVGSAAAESAIAWTGKNKTLENITDSIPIAKEVLTRESQLESEIRNFIETNLMLKEDELLVTGTGTTPQLKGVYTTADAFDASTYTGFRPTNAGIMDLILVMATEIEKETQYVVDTVLINPTDALGLYLEKSSDGFRMNLPMLDAAGNIVFRNIKVIQTASQAAGTMTVGDFTRGRRYFGEDLVIEFGYNASGDFAKRIITMLGNMERLLLIRDCEADAFLKSTNITDDLAAITNSGQ